METLSYLRVYKGFEKSRFFKYLENGTFFAGFGNL